MAYIEPKTNWVAGNIPAASDLNRFEGNTKANHDDINSEAATRLANDNTLQTNINSEAATRLANDNALDDRIDGIQGSYGIGSLAFLAVSAPEGYTLTYGTSVNSATDDLYLAGVSYPDSQVVVLGAKIAVGIWRVIGHILGTSTSDYSATLFQRVS